MVASFQIIAALDADGGIGRQGALPWHLPNEMNHFTRTTRSTSDPLLQNAIFMGRRNWEISNEERPLPGRLNIVMTRRGDLDVPDEVRLAASIDDALALSAAAGAESVYCIGGAGLYARALAHSACRALLLTRIDAHYDCDVFFPAFQDHYALAERLAGGVDDEVHWTVERWRPI